MGLTGIALGLGSGLALHRSGGAWVRPGALLDLDLSSARYHYAGRYYATRASVLDAIGGTESDAAIIVAPKLVGSELLADPGFDIGIADWVNGTSFESVGTLSWDSTNKRLKRNVPARDTGVSVQFRSGIPVTVTIGKAYRFALRYRGPNSMVAGGGGVGFSPFNFFSGKTVPSDLHMDADALYSDYASASANPMYLGALTNLEGAGNRDEYFDDQSIIEVVPLVGHNYQALSGVIEATTPASAGAAVVFQADTNDERNRVRLVWDASGHLRFVVTDNNTEVANLDLGVVAASTPFVVRFSSATNSFKASLNGDAIVSDTSGNHPGLAFLRIGRSFTGEAWTGTIARVTLFAATMSDGDMVAPEKAFAVYGDSTAHGDGAGVTLTWYEGLRTAYDPDRTVYNAGIGGQGVTSLRDGLLADAEHRQWTTIIMDRPNTGEVGSDWIAATKASVANLRTNRWLVVPPVLNSPSGQPSSSDTAITYAQAQLLADPFFAGHTFDATQQAAYVTEMNDDSTRAGSGDFIHFNNTGQAKQAARIKTTLDALGW